MDEFISSLSKEETLWWAEKIKEFRLKLVKEPRHYAMQVLGSKASTKEDLINKMDQLLEETREEVWQSYLEDEAKFHAEVLHELFKTRDVPKAILLQLVDSKILSADINDRDILAEKVAEVVGEYAGRTMPYIYQLSLSTTQSRRSRAGKTFEQIIEAFLEIFGIPFDNQESVGSSFYRQNSLGKKVDGIVPGGNEYIRNRAKCAIVTMKTTLRERWQEVAEELSRTNVPHIYLLTVDRAVTNNVVDTISTYNITLVVYGSEKANKFSTKENVISFKDFFSYEMPHIVQYWTGRTD